MDILTSIETVMDSDLLHYGRPGMKWGVRNGPPYPLQYSKMSPEERQKIPRPKLTKKEEAAYKEQIESKEAATSAKRTADNRKRRMKKVGLSQNEDGSYTLKEGTNIRRVSSEDDDKRSSAKYVSVTSADAKVYDDDVYELGMEEGQTPYTYEFKAKKDLRIANEDDVLDFLLDKYGNDTNRADVEAYQKQRGKDQIYVNAKHGKAEGWLWDYAFGVEKLARTFVHRELYDIDRVHQREVLDHFSSLGYDAIMDIEDRINRFDAPILIIDPESSMAQTRKEKWEDYNLKKSYKNSLSHSDFLSAVELVLPDDALQYGIKGMKWGHRNGPPYPLDQETHEKVTKGEDTGVYKKGSKFYRVSTKEREDLSTTDYKYVTTLKKDRDVYRGPMATDWMYDESESIEDYTKHTIQEIYDNFAKRGFHMYELTFEAAKDLKSPSKSERQRMLKELVNEDPTVIDRAYDFFKHDKLTMKDKEKLNSIEWAFDKKRWTKANGTLGDLAYDPDAFYYFSEALNEAGDIRRQYFDKVKKSGYNMIVDDHDAGILSERPFIVIDPIETLTQVYAEELNGKSIEKSFRRWERAQDWYTEDEKSFVGHSDFLSAVELVLPDDALQYGVIGQKWGIRKWQNKDGTLTPAGRERWINSLKQEAYAASKKWEEYQQVRKQVINMHYEGKFDNELETKMLRLKEEANEAGAVWGSLRKRIESYLENGPDVSTSEPVEDAPHKVLIPVSDEKKYQHFLDLGYEEKGRNDTWIYMVNRKKYVKHSDTNQNDVLAAVETVMDGDIEHHGRRGQKWGVRNGPPYPLDPERLSARERMLDKEGKNIAATGPQKGWQKSKLLTEFAKVPYTGALDARLTKLGRKHMAEMLSKKELQEWGEANKQAHAHSLKKAGIQKSEEGGHTMKVGSELYRIADATDQVDDKRKYVSATENDKERYNEVFDKGFLALHKRDTATEFQYQGDKDIRVADAADVLDYVVGKYGGKREKQLLEDVKRAHQFQDVLKELNVTGLGSAADIAVANYLANTAPMELRSFVKSQLWDGSSDQGKKVYANNKQSEILGHYRDLGYDAIVDVEDYLSGFEYPMIMIDPKKSMSVKNKRALDPDMEDPDRRARLTEAGVKRQSSSDDVIAKGTTFTRQATANDDQYHDRKYMSVTKKDTDYYRKEFGDEAEYRYEAKKKLKVASAKAVVDYIVKDMDNYGDSEEGKQLSALYDKYRGKTDGWIWQIKANKERDRFENEVVAKQRTKYGRESETEFNSQKQILDHFSQLGYDAIVDINQSWQGMDYPVIIIDPDDSTKLKTKITKRTFKDKVENY